MMKSSDLMAYLEEQFPEIDFYNGTIDKNNPTCVGIYIRGRGEPRIALGGVENTSFGELPVSLLVHWTTNTDTCNTMANTLYAKLFGIGQVTMGTVKVIYLNMLDSSPVNIDRDENGVCEMVIRLNIVYER